MHLTHPLSNDFTPHLHLVQLLAIWKQIAAAHTALSATFNSLHTAVGKDTMKKSVYNSAMNI
jgi:hypothetical protein